MKTCLVGACPAIISAGPATCAPADSGGATYASAAIKNVVAYRRTVQK